MPLTIMILIHSFCALNYIMNPSPGLNKSQISIMYLYSKYEVKLEVLTVLGVFVTLNVRIALSEVC